MRHLFLIASYVCCVCLSPQLLAAQLKVGVILPLSGEHASLGHYLKNGLDLAFKGLDASDRAKVELFFEDDQLQTPQTVAAYQKLHSTKGIQAVMVLGSGSGNALVPITEADHVLLFALGASDPGVARGRNLAFIPWIPVETEGNAFVAEVKRRGYKRLAMLSGEQAGMIATHDAILDALKREGLEGMVVLDELVLPDTRDFNTFIAKAKAKRVDAVSTCLWQTPLSIFAREARQRELKADLAGVETFEDETAVKASEGALIGQWYVNSDDASPAFVEKYRAAYGSVPGWSAAHAFDALMLLIEGFRLHGTDVPAIAGYLRSVKNFRGATGSFSAMIGGRFDFPVAVKVVKADGFAKLH